MQRRLTQLLVGASSALFLAHAVPASAQELTIFWAEWDPANYLQELVNDYTAETGVTVTVQTTPWSDFQTKTFAELNAHGDAYDLVVGDSPVARRRLDRRPLCRPDRLPQQGQPQGPFRPGDAEVLLRIRRQVLGDPARGRRQRLGLPQGLVRGSQGDGRLQGEVRLRPRRAQGLQAAARHRRVLHPPGREPLRPRALHPDLLRRAGDGRRADHLHLRRRSRRLCDRQGRRHHQLAAERRGAANSTATSTSSRRRTGARRSSSRTTRRSPRAWRR